MVKDHSDSERGNTGYAFRLAARFFYMHHPTERMAHTMAFGTPVMAHWPKREIVPWVEQRDRSDNQSVWD